MKFLKEHLLREGYNWELGNGLHNMKDLSPTRNRFDRINGYCILHMLNLFDALVITLTVREAQRLELLIATELPSAATNEMSVFNWLKMNYIYLFPAKTLN